MKINRSLVSAAAKPTSSAVTPAMAKKGTAILKDKLAAHFKNDGVVSLVGKTTFKPTGKPGIVEAQGKVDVNALWGGDEKRSFKVLVDLNKGTISSLKTSVISVDN